MKHLVFKGTPPSTQHLYLRNGRMTYMSAEGKSCKEAYQWEIKCKRFSMTMEPISVIIEFYFKDERRRDLDNFNKILLDAGNGLLWRDDSQIQELVLRKFVDKKNSRTEMWIT